jgi:hypothetical protein
MAVVNIQPYDPDITSAPRDVIAAIEAGVSVQTRRIEFYESDAETPWYPDPANPTMKRLVDGSVTVDYNSDERRKLDCTLDNIDKLLRPNPTDGFWYDKTLKVFAGVEFNPADIEPHLVIIEAEDDDSSAGRNVARAISAAGFRDNTILLDEVDFSILRDYSWIVSGMSTSATAYHTELNSLWNNGKNIITFGTGNGLGEVPHYSMVSDPGTEITWGIAPVTQDSPTAGAFVTEEVGDAIGLCPTGLAAGVVSLAVWTNAPSPQFITAAMIRNQNGAFWLDIRLPILTKPETRKFLKRLLTYVRGYYGTRVWETQMGEYYIDRISEANFPNQVKVTARDATKKLINDKVSRNVTFAVGTSLNDLVIGQASLGGIPVSKMRFTMNSEILSNELSYDKGTSRWDIIKGALSSFNYEFFFDNTGNFVVRPFNDPTLSPIDFSFGTGVSGNLVSFEKAISDSRIFNWIQVTATPADSDTNPIGYFGEAVNIDPASPTNVDRIGNRVYTVDADWLTSDEDCMALASDYLKISALESYELSFSSIYYPWLECGSIVEILDPDAYDFEPTRFLLDSISYGLGLGPMSATGKRVTFVGSSGGSDELVA